MLKSPSGKIGLALVLAGLVLHLGARYWMVTRTLVALDIPISMVKGHIRSPEFNINLRSDYFIQIEVEKKGDIKNLECSMWGCYDTPAILKARWVLSDAKGPELSGDSDDTHGGSGTLGVVGRKIGYFESSGGRGRVDVDILSDARVLDIGKPRLKIEASGTGYNLVSRVYERSLFITGILIVIGATLLLLSRGAQRAEEIPSNEVAAAYRGAAQRLTIFRRLPQKALVSGLPSFALLASFVLLAVLIPFWLLAFWKTPARGIWVFTNRTAGYNVPVGVSAKPIVVRIDEQGQFLVDGNHVSNAEFPLALRQALGRRPDWTVYLDADPNLPFQVPATALGTMRELGARTILVTPATRQDCCMDGSEKTQKPSVR